jgi:hypothetical protein
MMLRRPARSLWVFLGLVVAVGTLFGHVLEGAAVAAFLLYVSSIDSKPAGSQDSGRGAGRFCTWRRVVPQSPREQRRMPRLNSY